MVDWQPRAGEIQVEFDPVNQRLYEQNHPACRYHQSAGPCEPDGGSDVEVKVARVMPRRSTHR